MRLETPEALRSAIDSALTAGGSAALVTHHNPDGDGFCACIAVQELYRLRGVHLDIVLEKPIADYYDYLEGRKRSRPMEDGLRYDTVIVLDCHETKRVGICAPLIESAGRVIVADHHEEVLPVAGADVYINPRKTSIGCVVFEMYEHEIAGLEVFASRSLILNALYTTLLNDTDNFANLNTDAEAFDIASRMCRVGLIPTIAVREFIFRKTVAEVQFLGEVLASGDYRDEVFFVTSDRGMLERYGLPTEATSGVTRWLKGTRGIRLLGYFREGEPNHWRISMRADDIDVQRIAVKHGGGGHERAAGFDFTGSLDELKALILHEIEEQ